MPDTPLPPAKASDRESETPRLNRRQAAKVRTRQKVLEAARALCAERGLDPALAWNDLAARHGASPPRGPLNEAARLKAGFTPQELQAWR